MTHLTIPNLLGAAARARAAAAVRLSFEHAVLPPASASYDPVAGAAAQRLTLDSSIVVDLLTEAIMPLLPLIRSELGLPYFTDAVIEVGVELSIDGRTYRVGEAKRHGRRLGFHYVLDGAPDRIAGGALDLYEIEDRHGYRCCVDAAVEVTPELDSVTFWNPDMHAEVGAARPLVAGAQRFTVTGWVVSARDAHAGRPSSATETWMRPDFRVIPIPAHIRAALTGIAHPTLESLPVADAEAVLDWIEPIVERVTGSPLISVGDEQATTAGRSGLVVTALLVPRRDDRSRPIEVTHVGGRSMLSPGQAAVISGPLRWADDDVEDPVSDHVVRIEFVPTRTGRLTGAT